MWVIKDIFPDGGALIYCEIDNHYMQVEKESILKLHQEQLIVGFDNYVKKTKLSVIRSKIVMVSDIEALEFMQDNPDTDPYLTYEDGNWVVYYSEKIEIPQSEVEKPKTPVKKEKKFVVFTITDYRSYIYLKDKGGITYACQDAKRFDEEEAIARAKFATEHSSRGYIWKHMQVG